MFIQSVKNYFDIIVDLPYILQTLSAALAISIIFGFKKSEVKTFLLEIAKTTSVFGLIFFINLSLFILGTYIPIPNLGLWLPYLVGAVFYAFVYCRDNIKAKLIYIASILSLTVIVAQLGMVAGNCLSIIFPGFSILATKLVSDILILIFANLFRKYSMTKYEINFMHMMLNVCVCAFSTVIVIIYDLYNMHNFRDGLIFFSVYTIILICLYLINLVTYFMVWLLSRERNSVLDLQIEKQKQKAMAELLAVSEHNFCELSEIRHDLKNQYAYMQRMLTEKKYDRLQEYFEEMTGTFAKPPYKVIDCGNQSLDSIINMEVAKAESHGLQADVQIVVPKTLPFPETELFSICVNLIDNAIEACVREGITEPIQIKIDMQGDYLRILIINAVKDKKGKVDVSHTSKPNKKEHGYGIKIVKKIVKKYNGVYNVTIENGEYVSEAFLDTQSTLGEKKQYEQTIENSDL